MSLACYVAICRAGAALGPGHPSDRCPLNPCQGRGQARLRVYMCQAASTVRGCPAVTDGLDGELARLQDQGTGGMAPLATPRASAGPAALRPSRRSPRVRREPGAAVARQGLRAAGPATGSVPGSARCPASYGQSMRRVRDSALVAWRFCMSGGQPARRAPRALENRTESSHEARPQGGSLTGERSAMP